MFFKTVFFRNGVKNYIEFYTDCRNFQSFLINQKLNVKLVMMTSWRYVTSLKNAWITDSGKVCVVAFVQWCGTYRPP